MSLTYLGYLVSIVLIALALLFFVLSIVTGYLYADNYGRPTQKSLKNRLKYLSLGILSFALSGSVFLTTENISFSENICIFSGIIIAGALFVSLDYFVTTGTERFLDGRGRSLSSFRSNPIVRHKISIAPKDSGGNKDEQEKGSAIE